MEHLRDADIAVASKGRMTDLPGRVLLVDDEPAFQRLGAAWLRGLGHEVVVAGDGAAAEALLAGAAPDVVLLDLSMPPRFDPVAGLELVPRFLPTPVVVLTCHADHALALRGGAGRMGLPSQAGRAADAGLRRGARRAEGPAGCGVAAPAPRLRGGGPWHGRTLPGAGTAARRGAPAGAVRGAGRGAGPTGTGKELVARALHACSARACGPFVAVHCGALAADLLESELFGHMKGSFTGAHRDQPGLVETAHRGTLFLDEVGEMPPSMQVKLLRFLQDGTYLPVGGRVPKRAKARVVAATHRDLEAMVAAGVFREDLFYRLRGVVLRTPPLSDRPEDVVLLAVRFLRRAVPHAGFTPDALGWLAGRDWPGNVRELRATVEAAAALAEPGAETVDAALLRFAAGDPDEDGHPGPAGAGILDAAIADLESRMLRDALAASGGNQSEAARRLGVSRVGLGKKLTRLGLR